MNKQQAAQRIEKLRLEINDYRYKYHVLNESTMSEAAADSLKHELSQLEEQFPDLITLDSPTQRVAGEALSQFKKVTHEHRMLSLNDVFDTDELRKWFERMTKLAPEWDGSVFADLKLDGLACSLIYIDGKLEAGVTRGDGFVGEDVTQNIRTIDSVPLQLHSLGDQSHAYHQGRLEVRGEVIILNHDFAELNFQREQAGQPLFANPRNTAAGALRQLEPQLVAARPLRFRAYAVLHDTIQSKQDEYNVAKDLGFVTNDMARVFSDQTELITFIDSWQEQREDLPFGTDGVVVTVNNTAMFKKLGVVGKAPRGAVAYKYPAEQATTVIKDIIISVGRTGTAVPVAIMEPVLVAGSTVQRATLHNEDEIRRKDIRIGDTVIIQKAGDIIPEVLRPLTKLRTGKEAPYSMPSALKEHPLEFERKPGEAAWRAINLDDPSIFKRGLQHFASKGALDIDGLGTKSVELLVTEGLVSSIADIYRLKIEQIEALEGFASKSATQLIESIQSKKRPPLPRFIFGLGIRHVGQQTAADLAKRFKTFEGFLNATFEELSEIEGVGEVVAHSIEEWLVADQTKQLLNDLKDLDVWPQAYQQAAGPLAGERIVITGSVPGLGREEAFDVVRNHGGEIQTSVGKDTTMLVVGEKAGQSKRTKAASLGIPQVSAADFLEKING